MKKPFTLFALFFLFLFSKTMAQSDLAIGQWKSHLPFHEGITVTQSDTKIYYGTRFALLIIDKADRALQRMTKVEGLSKVGVSIVKYNRQSKVLVVVYNDGVIDLLKADGITTLPNIPGSNIVLGEKKVYDVFMANDSIAYLSANFGIATLNLRTGLFPNTIKTPLEVRSTAVFEGRIYAATEEGIYTADPGAGYNIDDFSNWEWLGGKDGFPADFSSGALMVYNQKLYAGVNDSLYVYDGNTAQYVHHLDNFTLQYLSAEGPHLLAGFRCKTGCEGKVLIFDENHSFSQAGSQCVSSPNYALEDEQGNIWYADNGRFFRVENNGSGACQWIDVNSPYSSNVFKMAHANNQLWIAAGGVDLTYSALFRRDGIFSLIDGNWNVYSANNVPALDGVSDFLDIRVHPENGKIYAGAFLDALVVFDPQTNEYQVFNETNSSLQWSVGDFQRARVAGIDFDRDNNLWVCNHNAPKPISVFKNDGAWKSFELPCLVDDQVFKIAVDDFGYKWIMSTNSGTGIIVFDEGDFDNPADDRCKVINTSNSVLPTNEVNDIEIDRDGSVWVATKSGALVFQCDPFGSECPGTRPFVEVDGFGANLLEDQDVRVVAVDGANRKWFGTATGVFVMSPEGGDQIAHFTQENSPLFDNNITDIEFDEVTGEVFIGTQRGLISYRGEATGAKSFHSGVLVFPNPVREDYDGPIAIKGLAEDATVKITDVSGQLVYETEALGGQAIWNGRDYTGRRANTGVYLVFATSRNSSSPEVAVAKILVVN
jgi:ligand-binding sensor domain-containing protein